MKPSCVTCEPIRLLILALLCVVTVLRARAQETNSVELTQSDLFSLPDWRHRKVAVNGFTLGITRAQVSKIAEVENLRLVPIGPGLTMKELRGQCVQSHCAVYRANGPSMGVDLFFDSERVTKLQVGLSVDMDPEVKKSNVANLFKGLTYKFFNHYSESLQNRILGAALAQRDDSTPIEGDHLSYLRYEYPDTGVVVHVTKDGVEPLDLAVDFVAPR